MATEKKPKTVKKITEIPEARVKIEIEQTDKAEAEAQTNKSAEEAIESDKTADKAEAEAQINKSAEEDATTDESIETKKDTEEPLEEEKESEIENFDDENSRFSWSKVILFILIAAVTGFIIVGGYLFFVEDYNFSMTKEEPKKELNVKEDVTPAPVADEVDKSAFEITVLNGSGIAGEAASVQTLLEDEGFSVSEIGNAETDDYTKTQILHSEDVEDEYLDALEKTLKTRGPVEVEKADRDQTEDVVVIVGSETSEADATPTPELE